MLFDWQDGEEFIQITGDRSAPVLTSSIDCVNNAEFAAAISGMESLLLSIISTGAARNSDELEEAVQTAIDAIANQYGDE
jgi:hypothetical protein